MEKHELVDKNGKKTGKILTHTEARNPDNIQKGYYKTGMCPMESKYKDENDINVIYNEMMNV